MWLMDQHAITACPIKSYNRSKTISNADQSSLRKHLGRQVFDLMIICLSSLNLCALALFIDLNTNYHVCILCVSYCHTPFGSLSYVPAVGFTTQQAAAAAVDPMQHIFVWITRVSLVLFTHTHKKNHGLKPRGGVTTTCVVLR